MSQRIDKIEQELVKLEGAVDIIGQQLLATYSKYLKLLGKSVQRQLIMAVYQVCTDVYPESFLRLSLNQRANLQTKVKQIAQGIVTQLLTPLTDLENIISPSISPTSIFTTIPTPIPDVINDLAPENVQEIEKVDKQEKTEKLTKIRQLVNWQQETDAEIIQLLQQGSKEVNNLLHQAKLIAQQLPIFLLEAAAKVESLNTAAVISRPNTLNLLVEMGNNPEVEAENDPENTAHISQSLSQSLPPEIVQHISFKGAAKESSKEILPLTAIYLRLGDLEFNDPELGNISNNLRALITKLHTLDREYHKQSKLYQVAQAQAAWRSTWTED